MAQRRPLRVFTQFHHAVQEAFQRASATRRRDARLDMQRLSEDSLSRGTLFLFCWAPPPSVPSRTSPHSSTVLPQREPMLLGHSGREVL
ncbi:hypothetical protein EYF80_041436 [Liparis tanakae]|uniref:Uncharacterized protein n=1 Tax=Liparis tanakae TaxID=230148 RepID=A0A4Z2G452_9TELE|nr:hypothetical protein EYF80_041436 [Liparis tanakae]